MLCILGRIVWSPVVKDNHLNLAPVRFLSGHFRRVYLIVQSPDGHSHVSHYRNAAIVHVAQRRNKTLDYLSFIATASAVGYRLRRRGKVDVYDASEAIAGGLAACVLRLATGRKFLLHLQGELLNLPAEHLSGARVRQIRWIVKGVSRLATRIRCVSRSILANAKAAGIPERKLVFIPPRCDTNLFSRAALRPDQDLKRLHGVSAKKVILFVGTLSIHKGVSYLLEAFSAVAGREADAVLLIVGSGELEGQLRALAERLGVAERVVFCGRVPYTKVPSYLSIADVFALPSIDEGLPRVVMEAMAMQVPVVATRVGGIPEIVTHGETGLLVEPANPGQLAEVIGYLLRDENGARAMGARGRQLIVEDYSFDEGMRKYRDALYEVAGLSPGEAAPAGPA